MYVLLVWNITIIPSQKRIRKITICNAHGCIRVIIVTSTNVARLNVNVLRVATSALQSEIYSSRNDIICTVRANTVIFIQVAVVFSGPTGKSTCIIYDQIYENVACFRPYLARCYFTVSTGKLWSYFCFEVKWVINLKNGRGRVKLSFFKLSMFVRE